MKIAAIQSNLVWCDQNSNRASLQKQMFESAKADIYVLPEMFSTGFCTGNSDFAETVLADGSCASLLWMKECALKLDAAIVGSVAVKMPEGCRNRLYFVFPDGSHQFYDKRHLFTYGGEDKYFSAGDRRVIVEFRGWKFLLAVCYDLRFPKWLRNGLDSNGVPAYDAMLLVASWPDRRRFAWDALIKARAIENQSYVVAVNRVGDDPSCHYSGGSAIIDFAGQTITSSDKQSVLQGELDKEELNAFREHFPFLMDADI
ncbi:MAG: nitrilase-related carbon-nitrogen hydrolase [Candidatus Cryptobacteroides sp.]